MEENSQDNQIIKDSISKNWKDQDFPKWFKVEAGEQTESTWNKFFGKGRTRYEDYFISQLRSIYMDLDGDLRTLAPEYSGVTDIEEKNYVDEIGKYIDNLLNAARGILENQKLSKRQMLVASSILNEVEECLVWITPPALALAHMPDLLLKLNNIDSPDKYRYISMLEDCQKILKTSQDKNEKLSKQETERYRAAIEECINFIYSQTLKDIINTGLQIERLRSLRYWGIILLALFIFIFPMISRTDVWPLYVNTTAYWNATINSTSFFGQYFKPWIYTIGAWYTAISFCIVGGIGGFLSGLLQVRDSKTDLGMYEVSILLFQIRPVFGAFAALVSFMLLSWGVLSGVITESANSYTLVAFVSGFSERYFINLFDKMQGEVKPPDIQIKKEDIVSSNPEEPQIQR
ncbi:MAG: hypothetical protein ACP5OU_09285 [Methanothrix sp.]